MVMVKALKRAGSGHHQSHVQSKHSDHFYLIVVSEARHSHGGERGWGHCLCLVLLWELQGHLLAPSAASKS